MVVSQAAISSVSKRNVNKAFAVTWANTHEYDRTKISTELSHDACSCYMQISAKFLLANTSRDEIYLPERNQKDTATNFILVINM